MRALIFLLLCSSSLAQDGAFDTKDARIMCTAANGILAAIFKDEIFSDLFTEEGRRHFSAAELLGGTLEEVERTMLGMKEAYNKGTMSKDQIVEFAQMCSQVFPIVEQENR